MKLTEEETIAPLPIPHMGVIGMDALRHRCATCAVIDACKYTFAKYWEDKSHGGVGCNYPVGGEQWAADVMLAAARRNAATDEHSHAPPTTPTSANIAPAEPIHVKAEERDGMSDWIVSHKEHEYATRAKSEAAAVNFIRFRLYGMRPLKSLPPFQARQAQPSEIEALKRAEAKGGVQEMSADAARARILRMIS